MSTNDTLFRLGTQQQRDLRAQLESLNDESWGEERGRTLWALSRSLEPGWSRRSWELTESIHWLGELLRLAPSDHPIRISTLLSLAKALMTLQTRDGLFQAAGHLEAALSSTRDPTSRLQALILLDRAQSVLARQSRLGLGSQADKTIGYLEELVSLMPPGEDRATKMCQLGYAYQSRYESKQDLSDMHSAILHLTKGFAEPSLPEDIRPQVQLDIGRAVFHRFEVTGAPGDLRSAITAFTNSTNEDSLPLGNVYDQLGGALACRHRLSRSPVDIEVAVELRRVAVMVLPATPLPPHVFVLSNFGLSLHQRFIALHDAADLEEAILYQTRALELHIPPIHRAMVQNRLGCALCDRYFLLHNDSDATEAVSNLIGAVQGIPPNAPQLGMFKPNLANILMALPQSFTADRLHLTVDKNILAAASLRQAALQTNNEPTMRLEAAIRWARFAHHHGKFAYAMEGYTAAISILPLTGWNGLAGWSRGESATRLLWLSGDAASCAIRLDAYEKAVEISEHVRSRFWNGLTHFRTDTAELMDIAPELAERVHNISTQLGALSPRFQIASNLLSGNMIGILPTAEAEDYAQRYRTLCEEWDECMAQVRKIQGHESFAQPLSYAQLRRASTLGPVVVLIAGTFHSDALVVQMDKPIQHVPLTGLAGDALAKMTVELHKESRAGRQGEVLREVLGTLWKEMCLPVLNALGVLKVGKPKQHIWWCATGQLAFLPIHAAGKYNKNHLPIKSQTIFQRVISSYTSTLGRLARAIDSQTRKASHSHHPPDCMLVGMKQRPPYTAPEVRSLPYVDEEMREVSSVFTPSHITRLTDEAATSPAVLTEISSHDFVHFACHGKQDWEVPIDSGLFLHDRPLTLLDLVIHQSSVHADKDSKTRTELDLVFLSACETSTGSGVLPDQAVHLAAGMQAVGFNTVIATLWPIQDLLAPRIAKQFYTRLTQARSSDEGERQLPRDAGTALHEAISSILAADASTSLWDWVPYVHIGL